LLKIIAALPLPLLNKKSSELSLPLFATAAFGELSKFCSFAEVGLILKSHLEIFFKLSILLGAPFLNNHDLKIIVKIIEKVIEN